MGDFMIKINLVCVGNLKDKFYLDAANEYIKRLQKFCKLSVIEIKEQNEKEMSVCLEKEGDEILTKLKGFCVALCVEGREKSSTEFSSFIEKTSMISSEITFIIGGSNGLSLEVKKNVNEVLSFSKMTFPHGLFRVCLLEQIYRSFTITNGIGYHK